MTLYNVTIQIINFFHQQIYNQVLNKLYEIEQEWNEQRVCICEFHKRRSSEEV